MKGSKYLILVAVLAVASLFSWNVYSADKKPNAVVWEYNVVSSITGDNMTRLTELGNDGWELTSIRTEEQMVGNYRQTKIYYYLKRSKQLGK